MHGFHWRVMAQSKLDRRRFLIGTAVAGAAGTVVAGIAGGHDGELGASPRIYRGGVPWQEGQADAPVGASGEGFAFFSVAEQAFIAAAVNRLIPPDPTGPSGTEAGVPYFLDRQLAGPYGQGDHFYLAGPWEKGTPEQGYQSRYTPAQLYRAAIAAIDRKVAADHGGPSFAQLADAERDATLKALEKGDLALDGGVDGKGFFTLFLQNVKEGYFADPIYGGNRDMGAWKMIGFPGSHYDYSQWVERHGERVTVAVVGIGGRPGWRQA
jgi:gluconate 2-dehydrogenase gamma chain